MEINIRSIQVGQGVAHLINSPSGLILVDTGTPGGEKKILDQIMALGREDLKLIFITHAHFDHYGCAAAIRRLTGAPIAIHEQDLEFLARGETPLGSVRGRGRIAQIFLPLAERVYQPEPIQADIVFGDGHRFMQFDSEMVVVHLPGHTPGSCGLLVDHRIVFAGDLVSTTGEPHPQRYYATDWSQLSKSLNRLKALQPEWVYPGHGRAPLSGQQLQRLEFPKD